MATSLRWAVVLVSTVAGAAVFGGCGSKTDQNTFCATCSVDGGGSANGDDDGGSGLNGGGGLGGSGSGTVSSSDLTITQTATTVSVTTGAAIPTVTFAVLDKGQPVAGTFSVADRGELGAVNSASGVFTPAGTLGGIVGVTGEYGGATVTGHLTITLHTVANGDPNAGMNGGTAGGGYGGVGGDGTGAAVTPASQTTLDTVAPTPDTTLAWLYPYDQTVFPQGILAPLMMWNVGAAGDYDAIKIHLTESYYEYTGYFAKPAGATTFKNYPVLADAWTALANSNAGNEAVSVDITLAKGTSTYTLPTRSWKIASGFLQGTVYYQAYNTQLVKNSNFTVPDPSGTQVQVGAATLGIKAGATSPVLVAGTSGSTAGEGCRVCHVVSGDGSTLMTQEGTSYPQTDRFALGSSGPSAGTAIGAADGTFAWGALSNDASLLFGNSGGNLAGAGSAPSQLYTTANAAAVATTGLPSDLQAATPSFSPDGKHLTFTFYGGGAGDGGTGGDTKSLGIADFDGVSAFTNLGIAYTPAMGQAVWPSFLPTNDGVIFEDQLAGSFGYTWSTSTGSLWWWDRTSGQAVALANLNGVALPDGPNGHTGATDAMLNFEPTVNPVPSGGYAWVVFTSRRMYGNVATLGAYDSDPRYNNTDSLTSPTPKKLWVAAVDLNGTAGVDPSHPAFYLPAQELLGGNSRGYWSVDPCAADGQSCATGDQCCGGYCQQAGDGGALVCSSAKPVCAQEYDKCTTSADCCTNAGTCINNRCATSVR